MSMLKRHVTYLDKTLHAFETMIKAGTKYASHQSLYAYNNSQLDTRLRLESAWQLQADKQTICLQLSLLHTLGKPPETSLSLNRWAKLYNSHPRGHLYHLFFYLLRCPLMIHAHDHIWQISLHRPEHIHHTNTRNPTHCLSIFGFVPTHHIRLYDTPGYCNAQTISPSIQFIPKEPYPIP
jgi:hypothetical protein